MITNTTRDALGSQQTTIASSTTETTIVTAAGTSGGGAAVSADLYGLIITNTSSTYTKVTIKDATAGTTRFVFSVPPQETRGFTVPAVAAVTQSAGNNNWTATCGTSVANIEITALFVRSI